MSWSDGILECQRLSSTCVIDWPAIVSGAVGLVTVVVAVLAWKTSKRAAEIAEDATRIARFQHVDSVRLRNEDARIIGRLLLHEVSALPARLNSLLPLIASAVAPSEPVTVLSTRALDTLLRECSFPMLPGSERVEGRIHNLSDSLGADLATLISNSRTLNDMVRLMAARTIELPPDTAPERRVRYVGKPGDFQLLREHLLFFKGLSIEYSNRFRDFVGVPAEDYTPYV